MFHRFGMLGAVCGIAAVFAACDGGGSVDDRTDLGPEPRDTGSGDAIIDGAAVDGADVPAKDDARDATSDGRADGTDVDGTDAGLACADPPTCPDGQRVVDCSTCVSELDRRCETDRDCRSGESCESRDGVSVCIYEPAPLETCPGGDGCGSGDEGPLRVGAASKIVTPQGFETPKPAGLDDDNTINFSAEQAPDDRWNDCGRDGLCPGDADYPGPDEGEDDGVAQGMWLAGFGIGRPAQYCPDEKIGCEAPDCCVSKYAHDHLRVQVTVIERGGVRVAFAVLDTIGWFHTDVEAIRERLPDELGVDYLVMAATHNHEAPDTAGQWGPGGQLPARSGRSERFVERIYSQTVAGIEEAVDGAESAEMRAAVLDVGWEGLAVDDSRPPYIFNDDVPVVRFVSEASGESIATMLSFGNHPEVLWNDNPYITADYPHFVRRYLREGIAPDLGGFGGVVLFFAGSVGGLINPGDGGAIAHDGGEPEQAHSFEAADALGQQLAGQVLEAESDGAFETIEQPDLAFARKEFLSPIENRKFQTAAYELGVLERDIYNTTPRAGLFEYAPEPPQILSEAGVVRLGSVTFFTAPGEVFPETLVGGFPGRPAVRDPVVGDVRELHTEATCGPDGLPSGGSGEHPCVVKPDQTNPPDWNRAPEPPYLYEQVPGEHPFFIGLGNDFVGYMVPEYDYEVDNYLEEAPGSHYEETNGIGEPILADWRSSLEAGFDALSE